MSATPCSSSRARAAPRSSVSSAMWFARPTVALGPGSHRPHCSSSRSRRGGGAGRRRSEHAALEDEVVRSRDLFEPERVAVEASRAIEIGDDQPAVLEALRHSRNLTGRRSHAADQGRALRLPHERRDERRAHREAHRRARRGDAPGPEGAHLGDRGGTQPEELGPRGQAVARAIRCRLPPRRRIWDPDRKERTCR